MMGRCHILGWPGIPLAWRVAVRHDVGTRHLMSNVHCQIGRIGDNAVLEHHVPLRRDQHQMLAPVAPHERDHAAAVDCQGFDKLKPPLARANGTAGQAQIETTDQP